jgi:serine protease Do
LDRIIYRKSNISNVKTEEEAVIQAVEKGRKSVVSITTLGHAREFFAVRPVQGMGSGVIVHPNGYVATNYHVVEMGGRLNVVLSDGREISGSIAGVDPSSDLAVVKVDEGNLPAAELADSDAIKVGQTVIAIGSPYGFFLGGLTVTKGVVSAVHRDIQLEDNIIEDLIQTDAAINPGNSGGPLVDIEGRVVGMSSAMIPFAQGIGFAIPSNTVKKVVEDLILYGKVSRSWLGIAGLTIDENIARQYRLDVSNGVGVASVARNGPADRAGLRSGDVITEVDGRPVSSIKELRRLVREKKPGEKSVLEVVRNGGRYSATVVLSEEQQLA